MEETKKLIKEEEQDFFKKLTERVGAVNMQVKLKNLLSGKIVFEVIS